MPHLSPHSQLPRSASCQWYSCSRDSAKVNIAPSAGVGAQPGEQIIDVAVARPLLRHATKAGEQQAK